MSSDPAIRPETRQWRRMGLRREVLILLPVALLLLVVLSSFTLLSFRNALSLLAVERQQEAARLARLVAERLAEAPAPSAETLRKLAPTARGVALLDAEGRPLTVAGDLPPSDLLSPIAGAGILRPVGVGPREDLGDSVAGFAPLAAAAGGRYVRVDLPAGALAGQLRGLRILSAVVLSINGALMLLVVLFTRHLLAPYETLLQRAKQMGEPSAGEGEIEFLLATFERALAELAEPQAGPEDDIAVVERTLLASLQSGLLLLDRKGSVLAINAVGAELLGTAQPAPGTPLAVVLRDLPEMSDLLASAVDQGGGLQRQECTVRVGEVARTLGLTLHPLRRDDGAVGGYLVLFADLTEARRHAEESRLSESLSRLGELAGGVAHELRNSLATLRGYLTLIERQPDEGSVADFLGEIRNESDHLQRVLEDFLSFARPGTARVQEFPLVPLLRRAAVDPALDGFDVRVHGAEPGALLRGDPQLLDRAIRNLLHNAVQAEREAGRSGPVEVTVQAQPEGVEVVVADRGPGIRPDIRERLFHPFVTGRPGGVGLGLSLAQRIVVLHGGRIRLEDREGGGARAVLFFPAEPGPGTPS
jgi:signal transduction histidine kinase